MKILVIGGTFFNGLHLVQELLHCGHNVTILNNDTTKTSMANEVQRLYADRKDHQQIKDVLGQKEFDVVYDTCAYVLDDVRSVIDIFKGRVGHYIFASSAVVYAATKILPITEDFPTDRGLFQTDYGQNKLLCEDYLKETYQCDQLPTTIARFGMVFGPDNILHDREQRMFIRFLKNREILIPGRGNTLGQIGHVDDEAKALCMMALNPRTFGEIYNITGKDYFSDEGYVDIVARVIGIEPRKKYIPAHIMDDIPLSTRKILIQRLAPHIHCWDASIILSIKKLYDHLGYEPTYTLETAVQQTYDWFMSKGLDKKREYDFSQEDELIKTICDQSQ